MKIVYIISMSIHRVGSQGGKVMSWHCLFVVCCLFVVVVVVFACNCVYTTQCLKACPSNNAHYDAQQCAL